MGTAEALAEGRGKAVFDFKSLCSSCGVGPGSRKVCVQVQDCSVSSSRPHLKHFSNLRPHRLRTDEGNDEGASESSLTFLNRHLSPSTEEAHEEQYQNGSYDRHDDAAALKPERRALGRKKRADNSPQ